MTLSDYIKRMVYTALNIFKTRFTRLSISINPTTNTNHNLATWIQIKNSMLIKLMKTSRILTMICITFKTRLMLLSIHYNTKISHNTAPRILIKLMKANRILTTASLSHTTKIMVLKINPTFTWTIIRLDVHQNDAQHAFHQTHSNLHNVERHQAVQHQHGKVNDHVHPQHQNAKHDVHQQCYHYVNPQVHHNHAHQQHAHQQHAHQQHAHQKELLENTHHDLH